MSIIGNGIHIIEKPDWMSWDEIHYVLWKAHAQNRERGMNMAFPALPSEKIREKIEEGHGKMLVALFDGVLVGTAAIKEKNTILWCGTHRCAYTCFIAVIPEYQRTGVYKSLCKRLEEEALSMRLSYMMFDTHELNHRMISINKKNGYIPVDVSVWKDHYNVVMVKWLNGCPYPNWYCTIQFLIHKWYRKLRFKPGRVKRFGI